MNSSKFELRVSCGPSLWSPFQAVLVFYETDIFNQDLRFDRADVSKLETFLPTKILSSVDLTKVDSVHDVMVALIEAILNLNGDAELTIDVVPLAEHRYVMRVEYVSLTPVLETVKLCLYLISWIKSGLSHSSERVRNRVGGVIKNISNILPKPITLNMLLAAKKLQVPYLILEQHAAYISFGQGRHSVLYNYGCSEFNSYVGFGLQKKQIARNSNDTTEGLSDHPTDADQIG